MILPVDEGPGLFDGRGAKTMESFFLEYHAKNPAVFERIVEISRTLVAAGRTRFGIDLVFARLRWLTAIETSGDTFKINNNFGAFYARMVAHRFPELAECFKTRSQAREFDPRKARP